jgi:hypothetical protein
MTSKLRKAAIGALAALTLGADVTATVTPSAAQGWRSGHRWHAGYWRGGYYGWGAAPVVAGGHRRSRTRCARSSALCLWAGLLRRLLLAEPASL